MHVAAHVGDGQHPVGPYAGGPPPEALQVAMPPLDRFGPAELGRAVVVAVVIVIAVLMKVLAWPLRPDGRGIVDAAAEGVVDAFETLGPTFVKLGQLVASSSGLFPKPLADACLRCLDDVPPVPAAKARAVLEEDLGHRIDELFAEFDDTPLAAASVAQVHACVLRDGRHAVVKIQRPGIRHRMLVDLRAAYAGARLLQVFEFFRIANAPAIIRDLYSATMTELNSAVEADRQSRFRDRIGAFGCDSQNSIVEDTCLSDANVGDENFRGHVGELNSISSGGNCLKHELPVGADINGPEVVPEGAGQAVEEEEVPGERVDHHRLAVDGLMGAAGRVDDECGAHGFPLWSVRHRCSPVDVR